MVNCLSQDVEDVRKGEPGEVVEEDELIADGNGC